MVLATRGGVGAADWLLTIPFAAIGMTSSYAGSRIRNRIDALIFRRWVKRALFVIAVGLLAQYASALVA